MEKPKIRSVKEMWTDYYEGAVKPSIPQDAPKSLKSLLDKLGENSFYMGALYLLSEINKIGGEAFTEEEGAARLEEYHLELKEWFDGITNPKPPTKVH